MMRMFYTSTTRIASTTLFAGKVLGMVVLLSSLSFSAYAQRGPGLDSYGVPWSHTVVPEDGGNGDGNSPNDFGVTNGSLAACNKYWQDFSAGIVTGPNPCSALSPAAVSNTTSAACKKYLKAVISGVNIPKINPCPTQSGASANSAGNGCANHPNAPGCKPVGRK
jgi:hypothetical protein